MISILHEKVTQAVAHYVLAVEELECDPEFADTAAFSEKYGFTADQGANTILVASKKVEPTKYAVCVVLASTHLDVNKKVTKLLGVKKASFTDSDTTKALTNMEIGGITAIGITGYPIFVDKAVLDQPKVVMGGGNRSSKVVLNPHELLKLRNVEVVKDLANPNS
jgi:prolyl-tRNA editing enzyme YbaK/EbsC (Cys-tRNA(Pro) deacylase)